MISATHAECVRLLRPMLPQQAFAPAPSRVLAFFVHAAIVLCAWVAFGLVSAWTWPLLAIRRAGQLRLHHSERRACA
jgi:uncharacterized RDD family membrane protein YckC